ncbi:hypothetical protein [Campylobacter fetus]|nr:hypothetical protein [Campylobacter fetus]
MSEVHYLELKTLLLEQRESFLSLFPKKVHISFIVERLKVVIYCYIKSY